MLALGFYYLLIRTYKKKTNQKPKPNRSIFTPCQGQGGQEGKEGDSYKTEPWGQGRGHALPLLRKAVRGGGKGNEMGFKTLLARHCR